MRALMVFAVLLLTCSVASADEPANLPPADRAAISSVVNRQLDAFRHDDAPSAYAFASPHIQQMFGDPAHFMSMVQQGFPPVYRPSHVQIGDIVMRDGEIVQRVDLVGPDGRGELALYSMEKQPDGTWRISGCRLTDPDTVGT